MTFVAIGALRANYTTNESDSLVTGYYSLSHRLEVNALNGYCFTLVTA